MATRSLQHVSSPFGFGKTTGIDLPGETMGIVYGNKMTTINAACNSFGQTINVNMNADDVSLLFYYKWWNVISATYS